MTHFVIDINGNRGDGQGIAFERPEQPLRIELLDSAGELVREAQTLQDILFLDTRGLEAGIGVLRVSRAEDTGSPVQKSARCSAASIARRRTSGSY